jgi:hypothetical protein
MLAFHLNSGVYIIGTQNWNTSPFPWNTVTARRAFVLGESRYGRPLLDELVVP